MKMMSCIGCAALAAIAFGGDQSGYLARIGPAPLRFQPPSKGPEVSVALPPLAMSDPPAPPSSEHEPTGTNDAVTVEESPETTSASSPPPAQPAVVVEPAFTPQMLLQYFNHKGTNANGNESSVILPYQFFPPSNPTIPPPPSKATYTKQ
jgi:hypothetical protein